MDFARGLIVGRSWATMNGREPEFYAYKDQRIVEKAVGVILLDATADIDGRSNIVPWRLQIETPQARYHNLEIVLIPQHTKERLSKYLKKATNQRTYVEWMKETIRAYAEPDQKGLVVCKLALFEAERIPAWPEGDERFKDPDNYAKGYQWGLDGRKLCAIHYGTGIGDNFWNDAEVVFLFDEHILPKSAIISHTQGLRAERADEGELGAMKTFNSKPPGVTSLYEGERLRWTKQLALRGNARNYDERGVCGKQRLVIACDPKLFMANVHRLFPGANIRIVKANADSTTVQTQILSLLSNTQRHTVTQNEISKAVEKRWRAIAHYVMTPEFLSSIASLGWTYVKRRGRLGSYFERLLRNTQSEGILSAFHVAQSQEPPLSFVTRACSARAELGRIPRAFWMADFIGIDSLLGEGTMPAAYSADIRGRVIASVESGSSRREAAEEFDVSASSAIKWVAAYRTTGSCAAKPRGGSTSPLEKYTTFLLTLIEGQPDLTLDEVVCAMRKRKLPGSRTAVWRFFQRHKITFKKKPERGGAAARRRGAGAATLDARTGHV